MNIDGVSGRVRLGPGWPMSGVAGRDDGAEEHGEWKSSRWIRGITNVMHLHHGMLSEGEFFETVCQPDEPRVQGEGFV